MKSHVTDKVVSLLREMGHEVRAYGAVGEGTTDWSAVGAAVGKAVAAGEADQGILFCWTGTGVSIAANKVPGIRAALCNDAETAAGARKWNDANVLAMSLRKVTEALAAEILKAWFANICSKEEDDLACLSTLKQIEKELYSGN